MAGFDLTDAEWEIIAPLLPGRAERPRGGRPRRDDRRMLNGTFFVLRTGTPWRDLPERYGPYTTAYNRFNRWAKEGVWVRVFETLAARSPASMQLIDSSSARTSTLPAEKGGGSRHRSVCGGLSTKINARVDGPWAASPLTLTAGQAHDRRAVAELLPGLPAGSNVVADRSYDSRSVHALIEAAGAQPQIPTPRRRRVQRSVPPAIYRQRNLVERFFNKLKHFRRIATRYEKTARNYLAAVLLAAARLWTRFESTT